MTEVTVKKRSRASQRPTIRDVSRLAGVSRMTVSRVISEPQLVVPATRERVQKAAPVGVEDLRKVIVVRHARRPS